MERWGGNLEKGVRMLMVEKRKEREGERDFPIVSGDRNRQMYEIGIGIGGVGRILRIRGG